MRRRRRIRYALGGLMAAALVLVGLRAAKIIGPWSETAPSEVDGAASRVSGSSAVATEPAVVERGFLPRLTPPEHDGADSESGAPTGPKLSLLFADDCAFGVKGHCREWSERAETCDRGVAAECSKLGDLLIAQSPMQPLWGALLLQRACELGDDDVCARGQRWNEWARYGYLPNPPEKTDEPPGLSDACNAGNVVACGLLEMRRAKTTGFDKKVALASCRAGFRDVCAIVVDTTEDPTTLIAALQAGCELPDAWMCWHLAGYLSNYCPDKQRPACPPQDLPRADHYRRLACKLDPALTPCRDLR